MNVTRLRLQQEISEILAEQPLEIQQVFANCNLQQELMAYVLSRVPNCYERIDVERSPRSSPRFKPESTIRWLEREQLIYQGIQELFQKVINKSEKISFGQRLYR